MQSTAVNAPITLEEVALALISTGNRTEWSIMHGVIRASNFKSRVNNYILLASNMKGQISAQPHTSLCMQAFVNGK